RSSGRSRRIRRGTCARAGRRRCRPGRCRRSRYWRAWRAWWSSWSWRPSWSWWISWSWWTSWSCSFSSFSWWPFSSSVHHGEVDAEAVRVIAFGQAELLAVAALAVLAGRPFRTLQMFGDDVADDGAAARHLDLV